MTDAAKSKERGADEPVRWGVLGLADIARRAVIPAIEAVPRARLHAIATRGSTAVGGVNDGAAKTYAGEGAYEALLADPDVEAVYIPVPNHLHGHWATRALEAGKHVLCEKPLGVSPQDVAHLREVSERCSVLLMEAFMYRYNPQHRRLHELINSGALGEIQLVQASFTVSLEKPDENVRMLNEPGAGALFDVGVYAINTARWFFGEIPTSVYANASRRAASGADQVTSVVLNFSGGRAAVIDCALTLPYRNHYEVVGTRGAARVERPYASPPFQPAHDELVTTMTAVDGSVTTETCPDTDQYQLEVDAFSRAVRGDKSDLYPTTESAADAAVLAACLASMRSGRAEPVSTLVNTDAEGVRA